MSGFDDLRQPKQARRGVCRSCAKPTSGTVQIMLHERSPGVPQRAVVTHAYAVCEPCGVRIYQRLRSVMDEERQ